MTEKSSPQPAQWTVSIAGPDDVHRFDTELDALRFANQVNRTYLADLLAHPGNEVLCLATVTDASPPIESASAAGIKTHPWGEVDDSGPSDPFSNTEFGDDALQAPELVWHGLSQAEVMKVVGEICEYGTGFVAPLISVVEGIDKLLCERNATAPIPAPEGAQELPPLPATDYRLFYEDEGDEDHGDEGYQEVLDEPGYTAKEMRDYARAAIRAALAAPAPQAAPLAWLMTADDDGSADWVERGAAQPAPVAGFRAVPLGPLAGPQAARDPVAFVHWPQSGPPRLVWYSNKELYAAIAAKRHNDHVPDLLLYPAAPQTKESTNDR